MRFIWYTLLLCVTLLFSGCAPSSLEEYRAEGEALSREFRKTLRKIHNSHDLSMAYGTIREYYEKIADLAIGAQNFKARSQAATEMCDDSMDFSESEALIEELKRIYRIEGGEEIMENAQREAFFRLTRALE